MPLSTRFIVLLSLPLLAGASCVSAAPQVVASIAPLHSLVAAVMGDRGEPGLLLQGGESPHSFSLRPSDARMLNQADALFWIGPVLELPLARILPNLNTRRATSMIQVEGMQLLPARHLHHGDQAAGTATDRHQRHANPAHIDPHLWLSPGNALLMSAQIADTLAIADPDNAAYYQANARDLERRLHQLDRDLRRRLQGIDGHYAVFHDAYQYLEHRYGLHASGTVTTHPERSPGVAHLHELRAMLIEEQVRCLFSEPQFSTRLVKVLSEGLSIRHAILDPLGADIEPGPEAYFQILNKIADTIGECMSGPDGP